MRGPFALWRWQQLFADRSVFFKGLTSTLLISLLGLLLAIAIGTVLGLFSVSPIKPLRAFSRCYVEFFQNTPLMIQVFFYYNALPYAGIVLDVTLIGIIAVGLYHGAYVAEVVRAGINSIPAGQMEAAKSQGFHYITAMAYNILPQTMKIILPPLTNQAVNLIKNTSVLAMVAGGDLMYRANVWATSGSLNYGPSYAVTGVLYFLLCFPLATAARNYEERLKRQESRQEEAA